MGKKFQTLGLNKEKVLFISEDDVEKFHSSALRGGYWLAKHGSDDDFYEPGIDVTVYPYWDVEELGNSVLIRKGDSYIVRIHASEPVEVVGFKPVFSNFFYVIPASEVIEFYVKTKGDEYPRAWRIHVADNNIDVSLYPIELLQH